MLGGRRGGGGGRADDGKVNILFFLFVMSSFLKVKEKKERMRGRREGRGYYFHCYFASNIKQWVAINPS